MVSKGVDADTEGYSAFTSPELLPLLLEKDVKEVDIVGLAFDFCVKQTALDAIKHFKIVRVHRDMTASVFVENQEKDASDLTNAGVIML